MGEGRGGPLVPRRSSANGGEGGRGAFRADRRSRRAALARGADLSDAVLKVLQRLGAALGLVHDAAAAHDAHARARAQRAVDDAAARDARRAVVDVERLEHLWAGRRDRRRSRGEWMTGM